MVDLNAMFINGNTGESHIERLLNMLDVKYYRNIYIDNEERVCQIDFIVVSRSGLIVIEVKNFKSCLILGNYTNSYWTTKYTSSVHQFYNPIMQNFRHCNTLASSLANRGIKSNITSLLVFSSGCKFHLTDDSVKLRYKNIICTVREVWLELNDFLNGKYVYTKQEYQQLCDYFDEQLYRMSELSAKHRELYYS